VSSKPTIQIEAGLKSAAASCDLQTSLYDAAVEEMGSSLGRLVCGYEADSELRRDLLQEIHVELWRSFAGFKGHCSIRTWVYRIAHSVATSHVIRQRRFRMRALVDLDSVPDLPASDDVERAADRHATLEIALAMIRRLKPQDRQVMLLYLEDLDAASIGEITGMSPGNVAVRIHRIKRILARRFDSQIRARGDD